MQPTVPEEFESLCLMVEMGFYYKDSSRDAWKDFDGLIAHVVEKALSGGIAPVFSFSKIIWMDCWMRNMPKKT